MYLQILILLVLITFVGSYTTEPFGYELRPHNVACFRNAQNSMRCDPMKYKLKYFRPRGHRVYNTYNEDGKKMIYPSHRYMWQTPSIFNFFY